MTDPQTKSALISDSGMSTHKEQSFNNLSELRLTLRELENVLLRIKPAEKRFFYSIKIWISWISIRIVPSQKITKIQFIIVFVKSLFLQNTKEIGTVHTQDRDQTCSS